jgi:T-complex protein 1 subunit theta
MAKSMNLNAAAGLGGMLKEGFRTYEGLEGAVLRNIAAAKAIAMMVRTSLGPNGMNKLVVNHLEKIIVTSDCATILKELEVQHPAAKMLVLAAQMQETEYGDNTNFVSPNNIKREVYAFVTNLTSLGIIFRW